MAALIVSIVGVHFGRLGCARCVTVVGNTRVPQFRLPAESARRLAHHVSIAWAEGKHAALAHRFASTEGLEVQLLRFAANAEADHVRPFAVSMEADPGLGEGVARICILPSLTGVRWSVVV